MKIHGSDGLPPLQPLERTSTQAAPEQGAFGAVLKETLGQAQAASAPGAATAIRFRPPIQPIEDDADGAVQRLERFIDLLDDYRGKLADSRVTLRQLEPAVRSIEQARDALEPVLARLPEAEGLKDILNRALVTAESEIARYRRGDYLPA
jgi:exonuclease VII small subunit